tara:strand:- start:133 stop:840 length:708 start_codon:yes stop_codon:yes gene_type:complete
MARLFKLAVPILGGKLRGMWWSPFSGGKLARVYLGTYEAEQSEIMAGHLHTGCRFVDVGAHHGYYTLMASRIAGPTGSVLAFEPDSMNYRYLSKHVDWNKLDNVERLNSAVSFEKGTATFTKGTGTGTGHLSSNGDISVSTITLDEELSAREFEPTHIKIDVEGAEVDVLSGALSTLRTFQPTLFLSTHGPDVHAQCCDLLQDVGYQLIPILGDDLANTSELIAIAPAALDHQAA